MDTSKLMRRACRLALRAAAVVLLGAASATEARAQADDFGLWLTAGAEKKIDKKWSVGIETEMRTRNDARTADRWSIGADAGYRLAKWLRAGVGYAFLYDNNKEKVSLLDNGGYKHWRPSYWGPRHRVAASLTGSVGIGAWKLSLRERWQYTYRPAKATTRYDFADAQWEDGEVKGKGNSVLRSRLQVAYNIPKCKVDPYASVEAYNAWSFDKVRYTVGADMKLSKQHAVGAYYRYQKVYDDDADRSKHIVGVEYKFKF